MPFVLRNFSWVTSCTFLSSFVNFPPADQSDKKRKRGESSEVVRNAAEQGGDGGHRTGDGGSALIRTLFNLLVGFLFAPG